MLLARFTNDPLTLKKIIALVILGRCIAIGTINFIRMKPFYEPTAATSLFQ